MSNRKFMKSEGQDFKNCQRLCDTCCYVEWKLILQFSSDQSPSHVQLFVTPWTAECKASLSLTNSQSLLKLMSIEWVMSSNHPLSSPFLSTFNLSQHPGLLNESVLHITWPKYWGFCLSISPSNEYSGLISFSIDWLVLLAVQGTLKSLLQHHSSKTSILLCLGFFIVQLSHTYMTTGKTIALARQTFVGKVMSLLLNMLSRWVIAFLPRSKSLLISWLQSLSAVILEPKKIKPLTVSIRSPSICHEMMGLDTMMLVSWILSFRQLFHSSLSLSSRGSLVLLHFLK